MQNRILNPQILIQYLDLYTQYRDRNSSTVAGWLKTAANMAASTASGQTDVNTQIQEKIKFVKSEINAARDFDGWYKLIFTLRDQAEQARGLLTIKGNSVSCFTLHALAGLIILQLQKYGPELNLRMESLREKIIELDIQKNKLMTTEQGKGVSDLNIQKDQYITELALLGDSFYCDEAIRLKLINLKKPNVSEIVEIGCENAANYQVPLCLQPEFCEWYYIFKFQDAPKISFQEFVIKASLDEEERKKYEMMKRIQGDTVAQLEEIYKVKKGSSSGSSDNLTSPSISSASSIEPKELQMVDINVINQETPGISNHPSALFSEQYARQYTEAEEKEPESLYTNTP